MSDDTNKPQDPHTGGNDKAPVDHYSAFARLDAISRQLSVLERKLARTESFAMRCWQLLQRGSLVLGGEYIGEDGDEQAPMLPVGIDKNHGRLSRIEDGIFEALGSLAGLRKHECEALPKPCSKYDWLPKQVMLQIALLKPAHVDTLTSIPGFVECYAAETPQMVIDTVVEALRRSYSEAELEEMVYAPFTYPDIGSSTL